MSCNCGESKCSCSERCFCLSELCLCTVCFHLKENWAVKSEERSVPVESSSNDSIVPLKSDKTNASNNSNSGEKNTEIVPSSYENLRSDLIPTESEKIKLGTEKGGFSNIVPEIALSDSEYEKASRQQHSSKISEWSLKKKDCFLKLKPDNKAAALKFGKYRRYFEYFSNKVTNSKCKSRSRSWNNCRVQKDGFKLISRKSKLSQSQKQLSALEQHESEIESENESNKREIKVEGYNEHSNSTYFHDGSLSCSDYDTDESKSFKPSITSNRLSLLNIGGSFSEPEIVGCELSETEPCSRCKRKKRMLSYYKTLQKKEMLTQSGRFSKSEEGQSTLFGQKIDQIPSNKTEIQITQGASELLKNRPKDIVNLSVYDFDDKESEISSSDESLKFRNRSVKVDSSGKLKINFCPNASQPLFTGKSSEIDSAQNLNSDERNSQATNNQYVSSLNAGSSAETPNDYAVIHGIGRRIREKTSPKILRRIRRKRRKNIKCKREESSVKRKIKKDTKIKREIKKERLLMEKETSSIKKEIKEEMPQV